MLFFFNLEARYFKQTRDKNLRIRNIRTVKGPEFQVTL